MRHKILEDPDSVRLGYHMYEHPTRFYKRYLKRHARTNFAELRVLAAGDPTTFKKLVRREKPTFYLRIKSMPHRKSKKFDELKPKGTRELTEIEENNFTVKLCDMGNACYVNKHYSDVI